MQRASQPGHEYVSGYLRQPLRSLDEALSAHAEAMHRQPAPQAPEPERAPRRPRQPRVPPPERRRAAPPELGRRLAELEARQQWLARSGNALAARAADNEICALAAMLGEPAAGGRARRRQTAAGRLKVAC